MRLLKTFLLSLSFLPLIPLAGCKSEPDPLPPAVGRLLQQTVEAETLPASISDRKERMRAWEEMGRFYEKRGYQPAWSDARGPLPRAEELIQGIPALGVEGLAPKRYQPARLEALRKEVEAIESFDDPQAQRRLVDLDVELTYTFLALATHLSSGLLHPETLRVDWYTKPRDVDLVSRLEAALAEEGDVAETLRSLTPPQPEYERLQQALARYKEIAAKGGWPAVPEGDELKEGATGPRVAALKARLAATGDLPAQPADQAKQRQAPVFDAALASAVSRFQRRHGLEATGTVDEETLAELNVPVTKRLRQLQVNMERWRWMPGSLGDRHILVNVPEFHMRLVEGGREALEMKVVVGKDQSRTPVFSDKMTYLELNPAWNLPASIATEEILPKLQENPYYLASNDMEVVRGWGESEEVVDASAVDWSQIGQPGSEYRIRQRPGPANPLGKVKFMFPNEFNIYLHDTPADHLFDRSERGFSHGCIRLEKPMELARYLLKSDPKWTPEALQAALDSGEHAAVPLPKPLPVHILYWTAWVHEDGTVQFRKDVYGHDATLAEALAGEPPVWIDPATLRGEVRAEL